MSSSNTELPQNKISVADCPICRDIGCYEIWDLYPEDNTPPAIKKLKGSSNIRHCPLCLTSYRIKSERDGQHWMSAEYSITRIPK